MPATISITQQPYEFSPVNQKLIVSASYSDAQPDGFRFKCTVNLFVDFVNTIEIISYVPPNPAGVMIIDLYAILSEHIATKTQYGNTSIHAFNDESTIFINDVEYEVNCLVEAVWNVDGVLTDSGISGAMTPIFLVNGGYQIEDGFRPDPNDRYGMTDTSSRFISDRKYDTIQFTLDADISINSQTIIIPVMEGDWGVLTMVDKTSAIGVDDASGVTITMYSDGVPVTEAFASLSTSAIMHAGVYPSNLNASVAVTSVKPSLFPTWKYYTVKANDDKSATYYFINMAHYGLTDCKFTPVRMAFIGMAGGWEYQNFIKRNEESVEIERKRYQKVVGDYSGETFSMNKFDRGLTDVANITNRFLSINSDWLEENEFLFLRGLFVSNQVHWVQDDGSFIPVVVEDNSYTEKKARNGKLVNQSIRVKLANQLWT